ncbi:efflux RND transporter periplasmic adaptor subunit [Ochrobactrum quorumnocens]|uniref:efflux RND transporter periplasmic adaptor subunit n=1 Tax=Ochrobactrum quorumnocens TaxID=271865 RepID=UPI003B9E4C3F
MRQRSSLVFRKTWCSTRLAPLVVILTVNAGIAAPAPSLQSAATPGNIPVAVTIAKSSAYHPPLAFSGAIAARQLINLSFRVNGLIRERRAEVGQHVEKGQVLAIVDASEQQAALKVAQAGKVAAEAKLVEAKARFIRQKRLLQQGFTRRSDYDQADQQRQTAQNMLSSATAALESARQQLSYTQLVAPQSGIITTRNIETGQVVAAAQAAFVIAMDGPRDAVFDVQETLIHQTDVGMAVGLSLLSDPTVTAQGHIREIAPIIDSKAQTVRVKVEIPASMSRMALGASVTGRIAVATSQVVMMPWTAMTSDGGKTAVWKIDPEKDVANLVPVTVLAYEKARFAVSDGIAAGDRVVSGGAQLLRPGAAVTIMETNEQGSAPQ